MRSYEYVVLRYVHDLATSEFVNVGIVLWIPYSRRLLFRTNEKYTRLSNFFSDFDGLAYRQFIRQFNRRAKELSKLNEEPDLLQEGPATISDALERLIVAEEMVFQWSPVMSGVTADPEKRLQRLFWEYTLRHDDRSVRERRNETQISNQIDTVLEARGLTHRVAHGVSIEGDKYSYKFSIGWQNGKQQVLEPISFDYVNPNEVVEKANTWSGRLYTLSQEADFAMTGVVAPPQLPNMMEAFERAIAILRDAPQVRMIVRESEVERFVSEIERDLDHD